MNYAKVTAEDFIDFLVATPVNATAMDAQRTNPVGSVEPSHNAYTLLLHRLEPSNNALWLEVKAKVRLNSGVLVLHDTVLDKPYARKMDQVHHMWSGKHHAAGGPRLVHLRKDLQLVRAPDDPPRRPDQNLGIPPGAVLIACGQVNSPLKPFNHR